MTLLSPRCLECVARYVQMVKSPINEKLYNVPETFQLSNNPTPTEERFIRDNFVPRVSHLTVPWSPGNEVVLETLYVFNNIRVLLKKL